MRKILLLCVSIAAILSLAACSGERGAPSGSQSGSLPSSSSPFYGEFVTLVQLDAPRFGDEIAVVKTSYGEFKIMFFPEKAPKAVENFKALAQEGYYNGLIFHKVMDGRAAYTGDPDGYGYGGESIWGEPFEDELSFDLWHFNGAVSMTNTGPNSNGSQFFIVQASEVPDSMLDQMRSAGFPQEVIDRYTDVGGTPWLDHVNTIFGHVYEGMEVIDAITGVSVDENYRPNDEIIIETITITTAD